MPFREPDKTEPRCVAQTSRGNRCRRVGCIYVGSGAHLCLSHSRNGYIPFFQPADQIDPRIIMRQRAVLGLEDV